MKTLKFYLLRFADCGEDILIYVHKGTCVTLVATAPHGNLYVDVRHTTWNINERKLSETCGDDWGFQDVWDLIRLNGMSKFLNEFTEPTAE